MPQVSKYKLDKTLEDEMFRQFWLSLSSLGDASAVSSFFSDLLTSTEEVMLAKRFTVAVLILRGRRPVDIKQTLHVTDTTICSVASWLKNVKPRTKEVLQFIIKDASWQKILDRIDSLLDALPPGYGTNWSRVGKERRERRMDRVSRLALR